MKAFRFIFADPLLVRAGLKLALEPLGSRIQFAEASDYETLERALRRQRRVDTMAACRSKPRPQ